MKDLNTQQVVMRGNEISGMYKLLTVKTPQQHIDQFGPLQDRVPAKVFSKSVSKIPVDMWHCHLGYPSMDVVSSVLKNNQLPIVAIPTFTSCSACCLGKIHKLSFSSSTTVYEKPL